MGEDWVEEVPFLLVQCYFPVVQRSLVVIKPGMPPPCVHNSRPSIQDHALGLKSEIIPSHVPA